MLGQPGEEFLQVVPAADDVMHEFQHASGALLRDVVRQPEVEVLIDDAQRLRQVAVLKRRSAERDGLVECRERVAERPIAFAGQQHERLLIGLNVLGGADVPQPVNHIGHRNPPEVEALAARKDRGQHLVRLGRGKDKKGVGWRLLQRLQQGVERLLRQHVHLVEDVNLFGGSLRRNPHLLAQLADVVDLVVRGRVHLKHIQAAAVFEGQTRVALTARLGFVLALFLRRLAVDGLGEDACRGRLADATRPAEEVRVGQPIKAKRILEGVGNVLLRDDIFEERRPVLAGGNEVSLVSHGSVRV